MAYNLKLQTLSDLQLVKTTRTNYTKTIDIATTVISS